MKHTTNEPMPLQFVQLLTHLLSEPRLYAHLERLHDIALYDSGDYPIDANDKEALLSCKELSVRLKKFKLKDRKRISVLLNNTKC